MPLERKKKPVIKNILKNLKTIEERIKTRGCDKLSQLPPKMTNWGENLFFKSNASYSNLNIFKN